MFSVLFAIANGRYTVSKGKYVSSPNTFTFHILVEDSHNLVHLKVALIQADSSIRGNHPRTSINSSDSKKGTEYIFEDISTPWKIR